MKHSIRVKSTLLFVGMTAAVLIICWGINHWYLGTYYIMQKQNTLISAYDDINKVILSGTEDSNEVILMLEQFSEKSNISIIMIDSSGSTTFSSASSIQLQFLPIKLREYILGISDNKGESLYITSNYEILKTYDARLQSYYLENWGFMENNTIFIMSTPLTSIQESTEISNQFLGYVGILAILISSIGMFLATRTITKPILQLASISEKMSNLDFNIKYTGTAKDEVGILGNSMNKLSSRLEKTISELKSANNQLQKDLEEKNKIDEMRKDFLSNVSHELKTPIALIQGYAEGLQEGIMDDEENRNFYCEVIVDEAGKMNKIVKQLLILNQLEFGQDTVVMERFNIISLIQGILNSTKILIQQKGVTVDFQQDQEIFVWADEFKIEEVLTNYISNALYHVSGEKRIEINVEVEHGTARISVYNTGELIPEEELNKIWMKFYKVDKARTREYGGSGVGLSIVQAVMEAHHKKFGVRNTADGVEFWFELDCSND